MAAATSTMERFVIIVNGWKPLTIITKSWKPLTVITKRSILDVEAVLDPPLRIMSHFAKCSVISLKFWVCYL